MSKKDTCRTLVILTVFLGLSFLIFPVQPAHAQTPTVDTGFDAATPRPEPDLVIVREKFYGAEGVDLTPYGIGSGPVFFVQSIYFRFFVDNELGSIDSFTGLVEFPAGIEIIGIITDGDDLGGVLDDGILTATDQLFGIGSDPDAYSNKHRGFEPAGGEGTSEFVSTTSPQTLVFGMNVEEGVDDFRVIIDYGDSFPADLAFDVGAYAVGLLGGAPEPSTGFRLGDEFSDSEAGSLTGIALTATGGPVVGDSIPYDPLSNLFILRDTAQDTYVDGFDVQLSLPAPDLFEFDVSFVGSPVGITDGNHNGMLYVLDAEFGFGEVNFTDGALMQKPVGPLPGTKVDLTNLGGVSDLFVLRDSDASDSYVDRLNTVTYNFDQEIILPQSLMADPVGITDGVDGLLYVVGASGSFVSVDPAVPTVTDLALTPPLGTYIDLTGHDSAEAIFLLRQTPTDIRIDRFEIVSGLPTYDHAILTTMDTPAGVTDGPNGMLYVIGQGNDVPATLTVVDSDDGAILSSQSFMDFAGVNVSLTNVLPVETPVNPTPFDNISGLRHWSAPNPFNARVTISFEVVRRDLTRVELYDLQGQLVKILDAGTRDVGLHTVSWDGRDANRRFLASGTYLYRVVVGSRSATGKVVLAK